MADEHPKNLARPANNFPYVVAVLIMSTLGVIAVLAITLMRRAEDNTILIGAVFGFLMPTTLALLAFMKSQETHLSVNSRLDAFLVEARLAAKAEGMVEGRDRAERRADVLTAQVAQVQIKLAEPVDANTQAVIDNTAATDLNTDVRAGIQPKKFG